MNKRKLRMLYRRYLFSYTFEVVTAKPLPKRIKEEDVLCRLA